MTCLSRQVFAGYEVVRFYPGTASPRNARAGLAIKITGPLIGYYQPGTTYQFGLNGALPAAVTPAPAIAVVAPAAATPAPAAPA